MFRLFWATLLATAAALAGPPAEPSPKLSPRDVVEAQLAALRANDDPTADAGIRTTFRFASPENKRTTGPVERFIEMVKNPLYAPLLNHRAAHLSETTEKGDLARIKVTVIAGDSKEAAFVWILQRISAPDCEGCWMTSTVMRVESKDSPFQVARARYSRGGGSRVRPLLGAVRSASTSLWCSALSRPASSLRPSRV